MVLTKEEVLKLVEDKMNDYDIIGPVMTDKVLDFKAVNDIKKLVISDDVPYKSPKEVFFPQREKVLSFTKDMEVVEHKKSDKKLLIGPKPCDLKALKIMTAVFTKGEFVDDVFLNNLNNTTIVGIGCENEKNGCFCSMRGIDMNYSDLCDVFLQAENGSYNVLVFSEKGQELFDNKPEILERKELDDGELVLNENEIELFEEIDWDKMTRKCMGCGICTYICPTCHCFEFKDVKCDDTIDRYRCWDSCMNPKFTLHASGHNPRNAKADRYRQRIMHKFSYVKKNFGYTACTGCGRCIRSCPAGMNIKSIIEGIMEESK
jgi:sulfhydrogenase subunit beta (sulfur reductase)